MPKKVPQESRAPWTSEVIRAQDALERLRDGAARDELVGRLTDGAQGIVLHDIGPPPVHVEPFFGAVLYRDRIRAEEHVGQRTLRCGSVGDADGVADALRCGLTAKLERLRREDERARGHVELLQTPAPRADRLCVAVVVVQLRRAAIILRDHLWMYMHLAHTPSRSVTRGAVGAGRRATGTYEWKGDIVW